MWTTRTRVGWGVMTLLVAALILYASSYFIAGSDAYFERQKLVYEAHTAGILIHIGGMMVAAAMGPFQFLRSLRTWHPRVHRAMGRAYLTGALIGGLGGLYMAPYSAAGIVTHLGFAGLALGVLFTSGRAFLAIRDGDVQAHREWMTRSFALIFAAVTLRLYLPGLEAAFGEDTGYRIVAWACWLPHVAVAELMIRGGLRRQPEPRLAVA